jgi:response regulator RpfG family c-di-GMP phosphodiesterase
MNEIMKLIAALLTGFMRRQPARQLRVLIIEDNDVDVMEMERHVRDCPGWTSEARTSPKYARSLLQSEKFNAILLDVAFIADMDGFAFAQELKRNRRTQHVHVTFVTGAPDEFIRALHNHSHIFHTQAGQYIAYIAKPVTLEAIRDALKVAENGHGPIKIEASTSGIVWLLLILFLLLGIVIGSHPWFDLLTTPKP